MKSLKLPRLQFNQTEVRAEIAEIDRLLEYYMQRKMNKSAIDELYDRKRELVDLLYNN